MRITQRSLRSRRPRTLFCLVVAFCLVVGTVAFEAPQTSAAGRAQIPLFGIEAPAAGFPATPATLGAIPDNSPQCGVTPGTAKDVKFTVSGITAPLQDIRVNFTLSPAHTWIFDIDVILFSPNGTSHLVFGEVNDNSDIAGPYTFHDGAPASPTWHQAAATAASTAALPSGDYRTSAYGSAGGGNTLMLPVYAGLTTAQINGDWTLRFLDWCADDSGSVSSANLTLAGAATAPVQHVNDSDGDGRTDHWNLRNTGGGPNGAVTWFGLEAAHARPGEEAPAATSRGFIWGIASDSFVMEDFDGDNKSDLAVFRPGAPGNSFWYILNSSNGTVDQVNFGQAGDDESVVGDYDGDNKADIAVYRAGSTSDWWYRKSSVGGPGCTPANCVNIRWGQTGDFPAPGDYDGDGKNDFVVQRDAGGGLANFWILFANNTTSTNNQFGTPSDSVVPGDWDGDGKTDIAVARGIGGVWNWFYRPSGGGPDVHILWGASGTDFLTQGDYDGDGRTDQAVWRSTTGEYFYRGTTSGPRGVLWGVQGDYPMANFNVH